MKRHLTEHAAKRLTPCRCENTTSFDVVARQVCEDCCEIFIQCGVCQYDPCNLSEHVESVMGSINPWTVGNAIDSWNEAIARGTPPEEPPTQAPRSNP